MIIFHSYDLFHAILFFLGAGGMVIHSRAYVTTDGHVALIFLRCGHIKSSPLTDLLPEESDLIEFGDIRFDRIRRHPILQQSMTVACTPTTY